MKDYKSFGITDLMMREKVRGAVEGIENVKVAIREAFAEGGETLTEEQLNYYAAALSIKILTEVIATSIPGFKGEDF